MKLNRNTDNNIASYGYATDYSFMTVHANRQGIYLVDDLPGEMLQFNPNQPTGNRAKRIEQDPTDPYISLSVYRSDLPSGRTHAVTGVYSNIFMPVNYTTTEIMGREYMFIFDEDHRLCDHQYVLMIRSKEVSSLIDINNGVDTLKKLINGEIEGYGIREFKIGDTTITIYVKGESHFQMAPLSNTGKKIISCFCAWMHKSIERQLSILPNIDNTAVKVSPKWKILKNNDGKWYRWTYCNNSIIVTEKYEPKWFVDSDGERKFIESEVCKGGDIIATLFAERSRSKDVRILKRTLYSSDFNLQQEVCRLAPNSLFKIENERDGKVWH